MFLSQSPHTGASAVVGLFLRLGTDAWALFVQLLYKFALSLIVSNQYPILHFVIRCSVNLILYPKIFLRQTEIWLDYGDPHPLYAWADELAWTKVSITNKVHNWGTLVVVIVTQPLWALTNISSGIRLVHRRAELVTPSICGDRRLLGNNVEWHPRFSSQISNAPRHTLRLCF